MTRDMNRYIGHTEKKRQPEKKRPRLLHILALVLVCILGLGNCSPANTPDELPRGGELRWGILGVTDLTTLDPAHADEQQAVMVIDLIFDGLVRMDENLVVQPDGAESWQVSEDGTTYTFTLREGLTFGDGTPVTAQDFVYSINRALTPSTGAYAAPSQLQHIVGAEEVIRGEANTARGLVALDERTLQIQLDEPVAYFLSLLTFPHTFAVPRELAETNNEAWNERAFGTGPFRLREWTPGDSITLEANPHYWDGLPGIDTIWMPFLPDNEEAYQLYKQGDMDTIGSMQTGIPAARVSEVESLPDFRTAPALAVRYIGFNNHRDPFNNVSVRQAFALAVDRINIVQGVLAGTAEPTGRILPEGLAGSKLPVNEQAFDPDGARSALRLAGYLSGNELPPITLTYGLEGDNTAVAEMIQRSWREILGADVQLEAMELSEFSRRLDETYQNPEEGLDIYLSFWGADYPDPHNFLSQQLRSGSPNNNGHWSNPEFDRLVAQADQMGGLEQRDERLRLYNQAEQIALREVGWIPLYNPRINALVRPTVHGLEFTPLSIIAPDWTGVRIATEQEQSE